MAHFGVKVDNHMVGLSKPLEGIKYPSPLSHTNADKQTSEESLETTTTTTPTLHVKTRQSRDIHGDESKTPREVPHSAESKRYVSPLSDYAIAISPNMVDISATNTVGQSKSSPFKRTADEAFNRSAEKKTSNKSVDFFVEERIQMKKDEGGKKRGHRTEKKGSSVMVGNLKRHENINSNAKQVIHQTFAKKTSNKHVDKKDDTLKKENEGSTIDIRNRVEGSITSGSKDVTPSSKAWLSCSICLKAKQKQYFHPKQITRDASTRKCARCDENAPIICSICRFQKERSCYSQTGKKKRRCRDCTEAMQEEFDHVVITCFICQVKKHRSCYPERRCRDCIEAIYKKVKHAEHCTKKRRCTEAIEAIEAVYEENNLLASQLKQKIGILSGMQKALEDQLNAKHQEYDASRENEKMEVLPSNNQKQTEYNLNVEEKECKPLPVQNQGGNRNENLLTFNSLLEENQQLKQQLVQQQQQEVERNTKLIEENEKFKQQQQQQVERNKKLIEEIEKLKQQLMHQEGERETYAKVIEEKQMLKQQLMQQQQDHKIITSLKNELKAELECPVCLDTYDNPYMVADCGHRFCKCCIEDAIAKSGKECPLCRARVTSKRGLRKDELIGRIGEVLFKNEEVEGNQSHDDRGPPSRQQKQGENDRQQNNDRSGNRRGGNRGRRRR